MEHVEHRSELVSLTEAARLLDLRDERTVRRQLERHGIALVRLGRSVRVERRAIRELITAARSTTAPTPAIRIAKNHNAHSRTPHRASTMQEKTHKRKPPRRGWRQTIDSGLYRVHRVDCPASPERKRQPKCFCRFYCHHPTAGSSETNNRRLEARTVSEARLEKKRVQGNRDATGPVGISPTLTVKQFFETVYLAGKLLVDDTKRNYKSRFKHDIAPRIGSKRLRDVTLHDINLLVKCLEEDMARRREELGRPNPRHVENRLTVVKSIFKYAHDIGCIPRNPTAAVIPPRGDGRQPDESAEHNPRRILTEEQQRTLYRWAEREVAAGGRRARDAIGIMLGLLAALRIGETLGVWWPDIDLEQSALHIRRQWKGGPPDLEQAAPQRHEEDRRPRRARI